MLYLIIRSAKNLIRHRRRTIVTALLLTAALSVVVCQLFLREQYGGQIENLRETYGNRTLIAFRDELQYEGNPSNHAGNPYYEDYSGNRTYTFDAEAMAAYNHPYPMTPEMYEEIADVPYVSDASLAYMVRTYRLSDTVPAGLAGFVQSEFGETYDGAVIGCTIVGGSREEFERTVTEQNGRGVWSYRLVSGRYPEADGECAMTSYAASLFGKTVGDTIELYDIGGEVRAVLTITGLTALDFADCFRTSPANPRELTDMTFDLEDLFSLPGTPFDRMWEDPDDTELLKAQYPDTIKCYKTLFGAVFTTFDTAYALDEEHHFNNFAFSCTVEEEHTEEWIEHIRSVLPDAYADEFTAYSFSHTLEKRAEMPSVILGSAEKILLPALLITCGLLFLTVLLSLRERKQETGILCSLGIPAVHIHLTYALEHAFLGLLCSLASAAGAFLPFRLSEMNSAYLTSDALTYRVPLLWLPLTAGVVCAAFVFGFVLSAIRIRKDSPLKLLRRE